VQVSLATLEEVFLRIAAMSEGASEYVLIETNAIKWKSLPTNNSEWNAKDDEWDSFWERTAKWLCCRRQRSRTDLHSEEELDTASSSSTSYS
jgi:hypothetical protein